jgi:ApbE superfamily uncharacterized protein (UPF0280 family)
MSAAAALLPGGRLHLQHGPIDCLCRAWGEPAEIRAAYGQAAAFFAGVLDGLCLELPLLRSLLPAPRPAGAVAHAMYTACLPYADHGITPMAAVAGAVADAVLAAMVDGRDLARAFVNNGGDIAFHLTPGSSLRCGLLTNIPGIQTAPHPQAPGHQLATQKNAPDSQNYGLPPPVYPNFRTPRGIVDRLAINHMAGTLLLSASKPARGLATSGRACKGQGGRSFSCGIADAVSVLARTSAQADAAATIIGNAVDLPEYIDMLEHNAIDRRPANQIDPTTDLGDRLITFDVGQLSEQAIQAALDAGETKANTLLRDGLIEGAVLALHGRLRVCGSPPVLPLRVLPSPEPLELT